MSKPYLGKKPPITTISKSIQSLIIDDELVDNLFSILISNDISSLQTFFSTNSIPLTVTNKDAKGVKILK